MTKTQKTVRTTLIFAIKAIVTLLIFGLIFSRVDTGKVTASFLRVKTPLFLLSLAIFVTRNILGAYRHKILLDFKNCPYTLPVLTRYYFIGYFFNMFLPTVVGGDIARGYYLYRSSEAKEEALSTLIVERFLGIMAMMLLPLISVAIASSMGLDIFGQSVIKMIVASCAAFFVFFFTLLYIIPERKIDSLAALFPRRFRAPFVILRNVISYNRAYGVLFSAFLFSILFQFSTIVSTYIISLSLGDTTPFMYFVILMPVVWLISMLPVSINGLGLREGAFVFFFSMAGMPRETALTVSLLWFAQSLILGVLGGLVFLSEGRGIAQIMSFGKKGGKDTPQ